MSRHPLDRFHAKTAGRDLFVSAGFSGYRKAVIPAGAPDTQIRECEMAFFAGAAHLFYGIMNVLEPSEKPTAADIARLTAIRKELEDFAAAFAPAHVPTKGSA
ncbi:hypothetical protein [Parvibaculum sp.]|uniref:hypothetical protein n=1 Tax=Parvibaculum sp. TaxID=2024848 RepID=UPI002602EB12|nr:hypothetical protein [Parvibaculum sp.]MCW5727214.1 hypothetical protein [Parvibaculum sp.]